MNTRYYYTDALAAAWMAKNFGMIFHVKDFDPEGKLKKQTPEQFLCCGIGGYEGVTEQEGPFHIHPDSAHLLEPQIGDVGILNKQTYLRLSSKHWGDNLGNLLWDNDIPIIQRNGIAFMWPESEAV